MVGQDVSGLLSGREGVVGRARHNDVLDEAVFNHAVQQVACLGAVAVLLVCEPVAGPLVPGAVHEVQNVVGAAGVVVSRKPHVDDLANKKLLAGICLLPDVGVRLVRELLDAALGGSRLADGLEAAKSGEKFVSLCLVGRAATGVVLGVVVAWRKGCLRRDVAGLRALIARLAGGEGKASRSKCR